MSDEKGSDLLWPRSSQRDAPTEGLCVPRRGTQDRYGRHKVAAGLERECDSVARPADLCTCHSRACFKGAGDIAGVYDQYMRAPGTVVALVADGSLH